MDLAIKKSRTPPHTLLVLSDNTVRECKNSYFLMYLSNLVARFKLKAAGLLNLRKAHSHNAIDQLWGILARRIASTDALQSPESVKQVLLEELHRPALRSWLGIQTEVLVDKLDCVRAWKSHFEPQQVKLQGGLREDDKANHLFLAMLRRGGTKGACGLGSFVPEIYALEDLLIHSP